MYVRIHYGMLYAIYPCIYVLFGYLSICYLAIYLYIIWNAVGKGSVCYGLRARSAALAPAHLCSSACAPLTPLKHKTLQHAHDRDLDGTPATEPASWKPHAAPGKQVSPSVAAPIDDGQVHWGWIGGIAASEDKGLWPQRASQDEDAGDDARPIEMLQVDQSAVWGGRGGRGASGRGAWQELGVVGAGREEKDGSRGRWTWASSKARLAEMGSWAGVGVAAVVVVLEWRRRRRAGGGTQYTAM